MKKNIYAIALASSFFIASAYAAKANQCDLGHWCNIPNSTGSVIFDVHRDQGNTYVCELKSKEDKDISVMISSGKDFDFSTQNVSATQSGTRITLNGKFTGSDGQIAIRQTLSVNVDGVVNCHV